ncbi:DNA-binding transcriptional regulator [Parvibaculum sp.]|uniref:DNA-binding transcriptional regulator n=1 Tax=Parvibaculum sp. TaxID=2024848 RepID=UPI003211391E
MDKEPVQPVLRALRILEVLNEETVTTLERLHQRTALPKPTLVRLLDTLIAGKYVRRVSRRAGYGLTDRVLQLSDGFRHTDRVVEVARPIMHALTAKYKWPVALATFDGDAMIVRAGTLHKSPLGTGPNYLDARLPILLSALGRAYIAFCPETERQTILAVLRASKAPMNAMAKDDKAVTRLIASIRRLGYASTVPMPDELATGLAIPVMQGDEVVAALTMRYFGSAMSDEEAARRYLAPMRAAAEEISASLTG